MSHVITFRSFPEPHNYTRIAVPVHALYFTWSGREIDFLRARAITQIAKNQEPDAGACRCPAADPKRITDLANMQMSSSGPERYHGSFVC